MSRLIKLTAILAAPSLAALIVLISLGELRSGAAAAALIGITVALTFLVDRYLRRIAAIGSAVAHARTPAGAAPPELAGSLGELAGRLRDEQESRIAADLSARELSRAFDELAEPVLVLDQRLEVRRANRAAHDLLGAALETRPLAAVLRHPAVLAAAEAVVQAGGAREVEIALSGPVERQYAARLAGIADAGGEVLLTLRDLTGIKRGERMRADFVANASHELRTPLASLIGFIETLQGPARDDAPARERFLATMHQQGKRMARLIDDLLSLSRIELDEHLPPTRPVALKPLIAAAADQLELRARERGMRIEIEAAEGLPAAIGDADQLAQVLLNLIDNAVKYGKPNTAVSVAVKRLPRGEGPLARAEHGAVAISVRDHGEGIAPEHLPRLTERFYRVDAARSRDLGGTGLGLAIVKHIVNRHRGVLTIDSRPGEGSTFTIHLPAAGTSG